MIGLVNNFFDVTGTIAFEPKVRYLIFEKAGAQLHSVINSSKCFSAVNHAVQLRAIDRESVHVDTKVRPGLPIDYKLG